jgi:hypothetical protein
MQGQLQEAPVAVLVLCDVIEYISPERIKALRNVNICKKISQKVEEIFSGNMYAFQYECTLRNYLN